MGDSRGIPSASVDRAAALLKLEAWMLWRSTLRLGRAWFGFLWNFLNEVILLIMEDVDEGFDEAFGASRGALVRFRGVIQGTSAT